MSRKKKSERAPPEFVQHMRDQLAVALKAPHTDPAMRKALTDTVMKSHDDLIRRKAKQRGGTSGRTVTKLDALRAYLRELHRQHPDSNAAALARMAKPRAEGRAPRTVEDEARKIIKGE